MIQYTGPPPPGHAPGTTCRLLYKLNSYCGLHVSVMSLYIFITTLHYTALHCTALHYTALHCTTLHYTALHCTTLHGSDGSARQFTAMHGSDGSARTSSYLDKWNDLYVNYSMKLNRTIFIVSNQIRTVWSVWWPLAGEQSRACGSGRL